MSDDTKAKIRAVLEEHIGPGVVKGIGDKDSLREHGKTIEWVNVIIALETEFDVPLDEIVVMKCDTIDMIARLIDTIVSSDRAPGH